MSVALLIFAMLALTALIALAVPKVRSRAFEMAAKIVQPSGVGFKEAEHAASSMSGLGGLLLAIVAAVVVPIVMIQLLSDLLPDYFTSLGAIFDAISAVNTTGWPPIVATIFGFTSLILGVTAVGAVFALGTLLVIRFSRK